MTAKKKTKQKPTAKSAGKTRKRAISAKSSRTAPKKRAARKRVARRRRTADDNAEAEFKRAFQSRHAGGKAAPSQQAEDLQGLSREEQADSESVDELAEEGNVFEAGAVAGVEEADNTDEKEVHTREVPEDDVPEEYLDEQ